MTDFADHPRCETCGYWKPTDDWDTPPGFQQCTKAPLSDDMTEWDNASKVLRIKEAYTDRLMSAMDASSYRAEVYTRGDFYCPMHSALAVERAT